MMIAPVLFLIAAALAAYVLWPLFGKHHPQDVGVDAARAREDATFNALRDLDLDWSTGKLSDEDYQRQRAAVIAEAEAMASASIRDHAVRGTAP